MTCLLSSNPSASKRVQTPHDSPYRTLGEYFLSRHVLLEKYCTDTGYTVEAIRKKIERGELVRGVHFDSEGDRNIKIDQEAMSLWARGVPANVIKAWKDAEIQSVYDSSIGAGARRRYA